MHSNNKNDAIVRERSAAKLSCKPTGKHGQARSEAKFRWNFVSKEALRARNRRAAKRAAFLTL
jgi:hypothetical protein